MPLKSESGRRDALFLIYPAYGHVLPSLGVISELVKRGWRVRAATSGKFASLVEQAGATPLRFDPPVPEPVSLANLSSSGYEEVIRQVFLGVIKASPGIDATVAQDPPGVLAFDSALWSTGRAVAARHGLPAVHLCPTFIQQEPFTRASMRVGDPDEAAERKRLAEFGDTLVQVYDQHGMAGTSPQSFAADAREHTVVFVPRAFQPEAERFGAGYTFAGPCASTGGGEPSGWRPPAGDRPVLLLSLGTTANERLGVFTECVDSFADSPWHVVITLGGRFDPAELGGLPPNVEAHAWVNYADVLAHASACVCHAGMGSLMAALERGLPTVALPGQPETVDNARRFAELGLGPWLASETVTGEAVRKAVDAATTDPGIADRVAWMQRQIRDSGGASAAADAFESAGAA
ncbi:glycosyltransferase [Streptomonospora sediminis]